MHKKDVFHAQISVAYTHLWLMRSIIFYSWTQIDVQILSNAVKVCEVHKVDQENRHYEKGNIILKILQLAGNDFVYNDSTSVAAVEAKSYWARFSDLFTGETLQKIDCPQKDAIEKMWSALREENVSLIVTSAFLTLLSHSTVWFLCLYFNYSLSTVHWYINGLPRTPLLVNLMS